MRDGKKKRMQFEFMKSPREIMPNKNQSHPMRGAAPEKKVFIIRVFRYTVLFFLGSLS